MLTVKEYACVCCNTSNGKRGLWKRVGIISLWLCDTCRNKDKTEEDLIRMGYRIGYLDACEKARTIINNEL